MPDIMNNNNIVFKAKNLNLGYKITSKSSKIVLKDVNFEMKRGELIALIGANGAGKSTLIKTLCGFIAPISGDLLFENDVLSSFSKKELAKKIGVVLTERNSEGGFTAFELVSLGRYPYTGFFGTLSSEDEKIIENALSLVGISHLKNRYISELSDGERQKVIIAKSIAQQCPIIILDEPTAFLDLKSKVEITSLLRDLAKKEGKCIIMSSHDLELSLQLSDKLFLISKNAPVVYGATETLVLEGRLNDIFGKENSSIEFDDEIGMFKSKKSNKIAIKTSGEDIPHFWLKNALLRNGYMPTNEDSAIEIIAKSANCFIFKDSNQEIEFKTIESIIEKIHKG
ncbi:MAG: ABC transporter ATP-binding protein [Rikenellaceae bacterium]